jgi:hypothetical protein
MGQTIKHSELIKLGAHWLSLSHNGIEFGGSHYRYSHPIVLKELVSADFSIPDIIGFCAEYSTLIECKTSRQDYFADKLKSHRHHPKQSGNYRYYLVPENMISAEEVYEGWGLLETDGQNILVKLTAPYHCEPEIKVSEYHILYSFARRKKEKLLKYTQLGG